MTKEKKKEKKYFFPALFRFVTASLSILIFAVIAVQIALWGGIFWLQMESGQTWLENNLSKFTEESGYTVKVRNINGLTWSGVNIGTLNISDKTGSFLDGEQIRLNIRIHSLLSKSLSLSVTAKHLALHRLPEKKDKNGTNQTAIPSLKTDIYFNTLHIDKLSIKKLTLARNITGRDIETALDLSAKAEKSEQDIKLDLSLTTSKTNENFLPEKINAAALFSPDKALLTTTDIIITSPLYTLTGKGTIEFKNNSIDFKTHGSTSSLPNISGSLKADGHITGTLQKPELKVIGVLKLTDPVLDDLDDIYFTVTSDHTFAGNLDVATVYQKNNTAIGADFLYSKDILHLKKIKGTAPDLILTGFIDYNTSTYLASGQLDTSIKLDRYKNILKTNISGQSKATFVLSALNDLQAADISIKTEKIKFQDVLAETAEVKAAYSDIRSLWPDKAELSLNNASSREALFDNLKAVLTRTPEKSFYALSLEGKGKYQKPFALTGTADLEGNSLETAAARNISLIILPSKGTLEITGNLVQQNIDLTIKPENILLNTLPASISDILGELEMSGTVLIKNTLTSPTIKADLNLNSIQMLKKIPSLSMHMTGSVADGKAVTDISAKGHGIKKLQTHAEMPFSFSLYPFNIDDVKNNPLQASIIADMDLKTTTATILQKSMTLSGRINADIKASGTLESPTMTGKILLSDGTFTHAKSNIALKKIDMHATLNNKMLYIKKLKAQDKKNGKITANGKVGINRETMPIDLSIQTDKLDPFHNSDLLSGNFSGDILLSGDKKLYTMRGKITTDRINVTIPDQFNSTMPKLNIVKKDTKKTTAPDFMKSVKLNLKLIADDQVFVRGQGLDAEFGGTIKVSGTLAAPLYNGTFKSKWGRYKEFGKRFDLKHAFLRFQGTIPPSPYLNILAETKVKDITARINLSGNLKKPTIKLSSAPSLPHDEVLSRILFGKKMTKISPFQAIQLTNTLQRFSGNNSKKFEPISILRKVTGLDDLQVERDENGETTIGAGKYITDKVYLEARAGGDSIGAAKVKVDITPNIKAESKVGQDSTAGGGVFWQWDY